MLKNFFKKLNIIDYAIVFFILLIAVGIFFIGRDKFSPTAKMMKNQKQIEFDITLRAKKISASREILKIGDDIFLVVRNVPYTKLKIKNVQKWHWKVPIPNIRDLEKAMFIDDENSPYSYNFLITLQDAGIVTADGMVVQGNKLKIGLPVTVEGKDYKFNGVISDVRVISAK